VSDQVEAYYYGCKNDSGHYWFARDAEWRSTRDIIARLPSPAIAPYKVDGGFLKPPQIEGEATLTHVEGWSVLSFWDRSIDRRYGSCSTFVARGSHAFVAMCAIAHEQFPSVWNRYKFEIRLKPNETLQS
jgi:hypothetical protein